MSQTSTARTARASAARTAGLTVAQWNAAVDRGWAPSPAPSRNTVTAWASEELTVHQCAHLATVTPSTFRSYVARGQAPEAVRNLGRKPLWRRVDIIVWLLSRPGPGSRTDIHG